MRKLTKRECILIYIALLLLIFYLGNIVLLGPVKSAYAEADFNFQRKTAEREMADYDLTCLARIEELYETEKEEIGQMESAYAAIDTPEEMEIRLLPYFRKSELEVLSSYSEGEWVESNQGDKHRIYLGTITWKATGTKDGFLKLLEQIKADSMIVVDRFSVSETEQGSGQIEIEVSFGYMIPETYEAIQNRSENLESEIQ